MADSDAEVRHILEGLINRQIDDQQGQRGWSQGWDAFAAGSTPGGSAGLAADTLAIEFATGYAGGVTVTGFLFDVSALDGSDLLQ